MISIQYIMNLANIYPYLYPKFNQNPPLAEVDLSPT